MRTVIIPAALAAVLLGFQAVPANADWFDWWYTPRYEGPWCANASIGAGEVQENCQFRSFKECRQAIIGGNRGFCTQNPRFTGFAPPPERKVKHKKRQRTRG
jgi:hypothetical protein